MTGLPLSTIQYRIMNIVIERTLRTVPTLVNRRIERTLRTVLTLEEEERTIEVIKRFSERGFP